MDTDVIVAAMRSPQGASAALLRLVRLEQVTLLLSTAMVFEYEAVCNRSEHLQAAELSIQDADVFLNALVYLAEPVEMHFRWRPQLRDPDDEIILETAVNGQANCIITFNKKHFGSVPNTFGVEVLNPGELLRRIRR